MAGADTHNKAWEVAPGGGRARIKARSSARSTARSSSNSSSSSTSSSYKRRRCKRRGWVVGKEEQEVVVIYCSDLQTR